MTEAPPHNRQASSQQADRVATAIAPILQSNVPQATKTAEVAEVLLEVIADAVELDDTAELASRTGLAPVKVVRKALKVATRTAVNIARAVAELVVGRGKPLDEDEALYSAMYATKAAERVAVAVGGGMSREEALRREERHYRAHAEASKRREAAGEMVRSMTKIHGPLLSWNHAATRIPEDPRLDHKRANGYSFDPTKGPPKATGGVWPSQLPGCTCLPGPAVPGALVME